jgi:nucleoid-associated protein YgaU
LEDFKSSLLIEKKIVVEDGNSLWRIAKRTLGGGIYYSEIYKNNIKKINNPDLIFPGQVFNIPKIKK